MIEPRGCKPGTLRGSNNTYRLPKFRALGRYTVYLVSEVGVILRLLGQSSTTKRNLAGDTKENAKHSEGISLNGFGPSQKSSCG